MRAKCLMPMMILAFLTSVSPQTQARAVEIGPSVAARVQALTRATRWTQVAAIKIGFDAFHPQGMVRIGKDFYVSSVEVRRAPAKLTRAVNGHAYDAGAGVGHLFRIGPDGTLLADLVLGEGAIYHPGGIDYDGRSIWVPVSEYRPNSRAILYEVSPATMRATKAFSVADHVGSVVHDIASDRIEAVNWGSRKFYSWPARTKGIRSVAPTNASVPNRQNYIDYQDCHHAGHRLMLCGGVGEYRSDLQKPVFQLGGLDLVDLSSHRAVWQVPVSLWAPSGRVMTQNPFWIEAQADGLRAFFMPDDDRSTIFVFDTVVP